ncbi:MAG: queuosine precursor transporter [Holosporales bacterium]|jgi:uncharacterized integral membrane protein (TIGR00697 family)|nr:queuosine precursor transporter [Holosporales bacterium]
MDGVVEQIIYYMWKCRPELVSFGVMLISLAFLEFFFRLAGKSGLCAYNCIAVCLANIQVLHVTKYDVFSVPIPLGTVLFTTTFLSNNMISAKYGPSEANKSVLLSFVAYAFFSISLILSLMHKPVQGDAFLQESYQNYLAMKRLFTPSLRILCASFIAFLFSQFFNVLIFKRVSRTQLNKSVLNFISVSVSGLLDNLVFSSLAFYFWGPIRPSLSTLFGGYVLETTVIRCAVALVFVVVFRRRMVQ